MDYKNEIKNKGLKQSWIAKKLGISTVMLSYYLNNVRPITDEVKKGLEEILN